MRKSCCLWLSRAIYRSTTLPLSAKGEAVIASAAKQSLSLKEIASSPLAPRNDGALPNLMSLGGKGL